MPRQTRVAFISLGCVKNLVDSEKMLGLLAEAGCAVTDDEADADVIVVNTCGFLNAARAESINVIRQAASRKTSGRCRRVVVAGCLAQRDRDALVADVDGIDALVGVHRRDDIVQAVLDPPNRADDGHVDLYLGDYHPHVQLDVARLRLTPAHYAFLRISEGCDQRCTFCTIPSIRGPMHCKPPEVVLAEARELVADGALEISLIGQDTTSYGRDLPDGVHLGTLLRQLDRVDGLMWLRVMYAYPSSLTDETIDAIAECDRVVKYIDLPLQHINDRILKAMCRRTTRRHTERLLQRLRERIPDVRIRTTLIAGFPGETDREFEELLAFVRAARFDALGVFGYSHEPETAAGRMADRLPDDVIRQRVDVLMTEQQSVAFESADRMVGRTLRVLVDETEADGLVRGRHAGQAPMVDGVTYVDDPTARPGEVLEVRCTGRHDYDLVGVRADITAPARS